MGPVFDPENDPQGLLTLKEVGGGVFSGLWIGSTPVTSRGRGSRGKRGCGGGWGSESLDEGGREKFQSGRSSLKTENDSYNGEKKAALVGWVACSGATGTFRHPSKKGGN